MVQHIFYSVVPAVNDSAVAEDQLRRLTSVPLGSPLSPREVSQSIAAITATGRYAEVVAEATRVGTGVDVTFRLRPIGRIDLVRFFGAKALSKEALASVVRLELGSEYWPERIPKAISAISQAYRRRGYELVRTVPHVEEYGARVAIVFTISEGVPSTIKELRFAGDLGLDEGDLRNALPLKVGDVLDRSRLEDGLDAVRALYRERKYYGARVFPVQVSTDGHVLISVRAGPPYEVVFSGNHAFSDVALRSVLAYRGEETIDAAVVESLAQRLKRFYRFHGFHDVLVDGSQALRPDGSSAAIGFAIQEGQLLRVSHFTFKGNKAIPSEELKTQVERAVESGTPETDFDVRATDDPLGLAGKSGAPIGAEMPQTAFAGVYEESAWTEAIKAMRALYASRGFLRVKVELADVAVGQDGIGSATFSISEGPQAFVRDVEIKGLPPNFQSSALRQFISGQAGFNSERLERMRKQLLQELRRDGYAFAQLNATHEVDASSNWVDCSVTITANVQVRIQAILLVGNSHTVERVIRNQVAFEVGQIFNFEDLLKTQTNLLALGLFRSVEVEMLSPSEISDRKPVLITVRERPRFSANFGIGYFLAVGPRLVADFAASNLGGQGLNLTGHAELDVVSASQPVLTRVIDLSDLPPWEQIGAQANLSLQSRSLLPSPFGLRVDTVFDRVFRSQFRFNRVALSPSIDWTRLFQIPALPSLSPSLSLALRYELEYSYVQQTKSSLVLEVPTTNLQDQQRLRFLFGAFLLQSGRFTATLDLRDNALYPHLGLLVQGNVELTGAIQARDQALKPVTVSFVKTSGLVSAYIPFGPRVTLALSARGGRIFSLAPDSVTPPVRRFFLGGSTSIRGFNEDQLLAEDLRAQYRSEAQACRRLTISDGCTGAAAAIGAGQQVPSQGGELFALFKSELRFPIVGPIAGGVFFEAGNLWLANPGTIASLRYVVGGGIRYASPIGALALDVGANLFPDIFLNEPAFVIHFSIGYF